MKLQLYTVDGCKIQMAMESVYLYFILFPLNYVNKIYNDLCSNR